MSKSSATLAHKQLHRIFRVTTAAIPLAAFAIFENLATGGVIAYYPFNSETASVTPDLSGLANDATLVNGASGATATISTTSPMLGIGNLFTIPKSTTSTSGASALARVADGDPDFDRTYDEFSLSLWIKPTSQSGSTTGWTELPAAGTTGSGARLITGKSAGNGQRGWQLSKNPNGGNNQLSFSYYSDDTGAAGTSENIVHTFTTPQSDAEFMHVSIVYDDSDGPTTFFGMYINGILSTSIPVSSPNAGTSVFGGTRQAKLNGINGNAFQIANRGDSTGGTSAGFIGSIDDYLLLDNAATSVEVALVHGLGRLAGVAFGAQNASMTGTQILDVLNAYNTQASATAGGRMWQYQSSVGTGPIGTIGGSVVASDAFIVLGSDGSGVRVVPLHPGDLDLDGDVDGADFGVWQGGFPSTGGPPNVNGDADGDGDVDGADFIVWQTNFPFGPGPGASPVPEPSTLMLELAGAIGVGLSLLRRRRLKLRNS
jgi:hypothetical protein